MALQIEGIVDGGVHAEETLGRSSGLEALLLALSSSHGLMRILYPIIPPEPLLMRTGQSETAERRGVGTQFYEGDAARVWVATDDGTIAARAVRLGQISDGMVEVLAGLSQGEKVVTSGALFIDRAARND